jgi:hypothetical protein
MLDIVIHYSYVWNLSHVKDLVHCRGGLHTCAYTSVTRTDIFHLVKNNPKLHRPSVYATIDATVGCITYG